MSFQILGLVCTHLSEMPLLLLFKDFLLFFSDFGLKEYFPDVFVISIFVIPVSILSHLQRSEVRTLYF